ncbi:hypothetical protein PEC301296_42180 [Pectobacterium carotovorum subsp. carotovorum]|nr:hypothetical protein PEC301296_42180 [Pectobacterium carotovorum subsp. carotovorum]
MRFPQGASPRGRSVYLGSYMVGIRVFALFHR